MATKKPIKPPIPEKKPKAGLIRYFRGLVGVAILGAIALVIASFFMRVEVIKRLNTQARIAGSVVLSNPHAIRRGDNIDKTEIFARLERLGYRSVSQEPTQPGTYSRSANKLFLYVREAALPDGTFQKPGPYILRLAENKIDSLEHAKFKRPLKRIWLEAEPISYLGSTESKSTILRNLNAYPKHVIDAILAIEDERFYLHFGLDPIAIFRAIFTNLSAGRLVQGGSTLTQQLAKGLFFSSERTLARKVLEALAAISIETAFTKDQILEFYLNSVFLEQDGNVAIHGFATASQSLFGKPIEKVTLAEAATLAGLVKAPSYYSPRRQEKRANERRRVVLNKMYDLGFITLAEKNKAAIEAISIKPRTREQRLAPYFVDYIRRTIEDSLPESAPLRNDTESDPIRVFTGLEPQYQHCAEQAVDDGISQLEKQFPRLKKGGAKIQTALISISPSSGRVRAWVGGRSYNENQFDRVSQAKRQPGSAFKPFVYLTALDKTLNNYRVARTTTLLLDDAITYKMPNGDLWEPKNYDGKFRGEVTLRYALTHSLNIPTIELAMKVGIDSVAKTAELFGFGTNLPRVPSLALGAGEVSPLELAQAYTALANGGKLINVRAMTSITRLKDNEPLFTAVLEERRAAQEAATFVLTNILRSVVENGTGQVVRRMGLTGPIAAKTGTSNDTRDAWFAGYTPSLLTVVWVGYDNNEMHGLTGATGAAPIWTSYMKCVAPMEPELDFIAPEGIVYKRIDPRSGLLATPNCDQNAVTEIFVQDAAPITTCDDVYEHRWDNDLGENRPSSSDMRQRRREGFFEGLVDRLWQ